VFETLIEKVKERKRTHHHGGLLGAIAAAVEAAAPERRGKPKADTPRGGPRVSSLKLPSQLAGFP
jgi:hypothetical protein